MLDITVRVEKYKQHIHNDEIGQREKKECTTDIWAVGGKASQYRYIAGLVLNNGGYVIETIYKIVDSTHCVETNQNGIQALMGCYEKDKRLYYTDAINQTFNEYIHDGSRIGRYKFVVKDVDNETYKKFKGLKIYQRKRGDANPVHYYDLEEILIRNQNEKNN